MIRMKKYKVKILNYRNKLNIWLEKIDQFRDNWD
jgi:hypothetical protein